MGSKLHVGNLSYATTSSDLQQLFSPLGAVQSAEVVSDRGTGDSMGFGFVRMGSDEEARAAIAALHGRQHGGRALTVAEAKPRESDGRSSGFAPTAVGMRIPGGGRTNTPRSAPRG
jgi:RNA recognition motif-containing protein